MILSIFPGVGLLDSAFEAEGFCDRMNEAGPVVAGTGFQTQPA